MADRCRLRRRSGKCLVLVLTLPELSRAQGEVIARLVFHAIPRNKGEFLLVKGSKAILGSTIGVPS